MTDVFKLIEDHGLTLHGDIEHFAELVRAEAEKQEPVGYFSVNDYGNWEQNESNYGTPLYAAPPNTGAAVKAERKACVKVCDEHAEYWKNTSIVETQVAELRMNLEVLEKTIAELSDRIRPVLNESVLLDPYPKEEVRPMSAVATAFWETNNRVFSATRNIQAILKRLEV